MIGSLRGTVVEVHVAFFLLEVQGVGYVVKAAGPLLSSLVIGQEKMVYIHDHIREDAHDLIGFGSYAELELFERLLSVSGVGPKVALTIMSTGSVETIRRGIVQSDIGLLTSVPGVGKKTAQKIILDLQGHLVEEANLGPGDGEVVDALVGLGYSAQDAREALKTISPQVVDLSARVREALKSLSK